MYFYIIFSTKYLDLKSQENDRSFSSSYNDQVRITIKQESPCCTSQFTRFTKITWLRENFEVVDTFSPTRSIYSLYRRKFAKHGNMQRNPTTFGRIISEAFPNVENLRGFLGVGDEKERAYRLKYKHASLQSQQLKGFAGRKSRKLARKSTQASAKMSEASNELATTDKKFIYIFLYI